MLESHTDAEFKAKIAENPLEVTAHLVYADWLNEQDGRERDAAFRRSIAAWLQNYHDKGLKPYNETAVKGRPWFLWHEHPPEGVNGGQMECFDPPRDEFLIWINHDLPFGTGHPDDHGLYFQKKLHYPTWQAMEEAMNRHYSPVMPRTLPRSPRGFTKKKKRK